MEDNEKMDWVDLLHRARWDRIAGLFIVIALLVFLVTSCVKGMGSNGDEFDSISVLEIETEAETETETEHIQTVFLSPSTQYDNLYACNEDVTEASAMITLAYKVKAILENDGFIVYMCGENDSVVEKVEEGNKLGCDAYVALHTNSGGESGSGEGTECFYLSSVSGSYELGYAIYSRIAALTPTEDRGIKDENYHELYEILNNEYACCLIELEFHDQVDLSQWILDNMDELANNVVEGIESYLTTAKRAEQMAMASSQASTEEESVEDDSTADSETE